MTAPPSDEEAASGDVGLSTAVAWADLGDQLFKVLPVDCWTGDLFGFSVAISGVTAIVGVLSDDGNDNGSNSGSAYLFDTAASPTVQSPLNW